MKKTLGRVGLRLSVYGQKKKTFYTLIAVVFEDGNQGLGR